MKKAGIAGALVSLVGAGALAIGFIQAHEGTKYQSYLDSAKVATICTGHTGPEVHLGQTATPAVCSDLLNKDMTWVWQTEDNLIDNVAQLPVWTRAAVASFIFNVGQATFAQSSVLSHLNEGNIPAACRSLLLYTKVRVGPGGQLVYVPGLANRRADEYKLCMGEAW